MHLYEQIIPILTVYAYDVGSVGRINLFLGNFFFLSPSEIHKKKKKIKKSCLVAAWLLRLFQTLAGALSDPVTVNYLIFAK